MSQPRNEYKRQRQQQRKARREAKRTASTKQALRRSRRRQMFANPLERHAWQNRVKGRVIAPNFVRRYEKALRRVMRQVERDSFGYLLDEQAA